MLFADDAKIFSMDPVKFQRSLDSFNAWLKSRQLQLASEKCFVLNISKRHGQNNLALDNQDLSNESIAKDLGVFITQDLKWRT